MVVDPAGRRIVGPGNVPPKVHISVRSPRATGTSAWTIGIRSRLLVSTGMRRSAW